MNESLRHEPRIYSEAEKQEVHDLIKDMELELTDFSDEDPGDTMIHSSKGGGATYKIQSGWFGAVWLDMQYAFELIGDKDFEYQVRRTAEPVALAVAERKRGGGDKKNTIEEVRIMNSELKKVVARLKKIIGQSEEEVSVAEAA